jgi:hypothetical protein
MRTCLLSLLGLGLTLSAQEVTVTQSAGTIEIRLSRTTEQNYLLTRDQPIRFEIAGPGHVRVYSRLRWHDVTSSDTYELVLRKPKGVRRETLETERSAAARGPSGETFSKWRSFYIRVPKGKNEYRLELGAARSDTVAVRFSLEAPPAWKEVAPATRLTFLRVREDTLETVWFQVSDSQTVDLAVVGPASLLVEARLSYLPSMSGKQSVTVAVSENEMLLKSQQFDVVRAKNAVYANGTAPDISLDKRRGAAVPHSAGMQPSVVRRLRIPLPPGEHSVTVRFLAGKGRVGVLRFLIRGK